MFRKETWDASGFRMLWRAQVPRFLLHKAIYEKYDIFTYTKIFPRHQCHHDRVLAFVTLLRFSTVMMDRTISTIVFV